jgi:hypothetical protein
MVCKKWEGKKSHLCSRLLILLTAEEGEFVCGPRNLQAHGWCCSNLIEKNKIISLENGMLK